MRESDDFPPAVLQRIVQDDVARALQEDVRGGDLTAALIAPTQRTHARVLAREAAVLCGRPWAEATLRALDPTATATWHVAEGAAARPSRWCWKCRAVPARC